MRNKNTQAFGEVQEDITLCVEYSIFDRKDSLRMEGNIMKTVSLQKEFFSSGDGLNIGRVLDFQEKANALLQEVKGLLENGTFVKVSLTKGAYEHVPEYAVTNELGTHTCSLKQLLFECWAFEGNALDGDPDEEGAGLYLSPDTRYTDASWDMVLYWEQDILKSLSEAHL